MVGLYGWVQYGWFLFEFLHGNGHGISRVACSVQRLNACMCVYAKNCTCLCVQLLYPLCMLANVCFYVYIDAHVLSNVLFPQSSAFRKHFFGYVNWYTLS